MVIHTSDSGRRNGRVFPSRHLKLMHWNMEGIFSKANGNKLDDSNFLNNIIGQDVIALTETHVSEEMWKSGVLKIPGYVVKRRVRPKSRKAKKYSGGIAVAIKEELANSIRVLDSLSENVMWIEFQCSGGDKKFLLGVVYVSPIDSSYTKNILLNQFRTWEILTDELARFKTEYRIGLIGDMNARTGILTDFIVNDDDQYLDLPADYIPDCDLIRRNNCDKVVNAFGRKLLELCSMAGIRIVNGRIFGDSMGKKTCHQWNGSSTVDYFITDLEIFDVIQTFKVHDILDDISDHCPISAVINLGLVNNKAKDKRVKILECAPKKIKWNESVKEIFINKISSNEYQEKVKNLCKMNINSESQIEQVLSDINDLLRSASNCKVRGTKKQYKINTHKRKLNKPWFSEDFERMRVNLKKTGQALLKDTNNNLLRQNFFKMKKIYKSAVITKKREFKQKLYDRLESMSNENPKEYWELFEKLQNCQGNNVNVDSPIDDREWVDHYLKLLGPKVYDKNILNNIELEISRLLEQNECVELNQPITIEEIFRATKGLKKNKAVGIDQISNEMIVCALPFLHQALKRLFNSIMWIQYYPKLWKTGIIINLFKSGDIYNTDNYRGLTINSCLGKLFNCILNNRLVNYLAARNVICDNQIGFKKGRVLVITYLF